MFAHIKQYVNLPLKNPTALSGWAHKKHPHLREPGIESRVSAEPPIFGGHIWNTSKYPECLSSFIKESWSFTQGKALVTTVRNVLFSHFSISQQCFKLATCASRELRAWECRAWKKYVIDLYQTKVYHLSIILYTMHI